MSTVRRFDAATLGAAQKTPQGFLRVPARLTRVGVLTYKRADGSERRELRRPEQVFAAESLASLHDAPVTDLHPQQMVTPENVRELSVGHVSHATVRADGRFVEAQLVITDAKMIAAVESKTRREVSCGYTCKTLEAPGQWNGEHYDAEQIDIRYNHSGLGPAKWGRAGSDCAVRLDSGDALVIDADDPVDDPPSPPKKETPMELTTIKIDGIDAQVPKQCAQLLEQAITKRDTELAELKKGATEHKARVDSLQGELDGAKAKLLEATDAKRFDAAVQARIDLIGKARTVLGAEFKFDGVSARGIKEAVLCKVQNADATKLAAQTPEYVDARFDGVDFDKVDGGDDDEDELAAARLAMHGKSLKRSQRKDGGDPPKPRVPDWQRPLAVNAER